MYRPLLYIYIQYVFGKVREWEVCGIYMQDGVQIIFDAVCMRVRDQVCVGGWVVTTRNSPCG